ncbi:MAG: MarR family winged helix-turn-helix transcriptional regulator [Chloroflexota bacterium]
MTSFETTLLVQLSLTCTDAKRAFSQYIGLSQTRSQLLLSLLHGEISHASLQERLVIDGATLTREIKQFEAEGIVSRRFDPKDNRYTLVSLTAAGTQMATAQLEVYQSFQARFLEGISQEEQDAMLSVLERIRANIQRAEEGEDS